MVLSKVVFTAPRGTNDGHEVTTWHLERYLIDKVEVFTVFLDGEADFLEFKQG